MTDGRLIYSMSVSLDGFAASIDGSLDWGLVDPWHRAGLQSLHAVAPATIG